MEYLRIATTGALLWCVGALALSWWGSRRFGPKVYHAEPTGSGVRGVLYAFGAGMLPGAKESVRTHLGSWALGVGYHLGIFAAFALSLAGLLTPPLPPPLTAPLGIASLLGAACGVGLLLKRALDSSLRSFSVPDDYLSNGLTTLFASCAGAGALGLLPASLTSVTATALLLYLPFGKIRHCVFFFSTRYHFGAFFGRRGVLPPAGGDFHA